MEHSREVEVYNKIRDMIFNYDVVPGQKLQYQDLADKLGVSRTPVKNALNLLEREGFVKLTFNKGYYVAELSREEAENLFELRLILESEAARLAIQRLTEDSIGQLVKRNQDYQNAVESELNRQRFLIDRDFHLEIAVAARNQALYKHLKLVLEATFLRHRIDRLSNLRGYEVRSEHSNIVEAIASKDEKKATEAVHFHIQQHRNNIMSIL